MKNLENSVLPTWWDQQWDLLAPVLSVDAEVVVKCKDDGIGEEFGHANQTRVGQRHRQTSISLHQGLNFRQVLGNIESQTHRPLFHQDQGRSHSITNATCQV